MRRVTVVYHYEDGNWWAESPTRGLETFVAGGRTLEETRQLAHEGAEFHLGDKVAVSEYFDPRHVVTHLEVTAVAGGLPVTVYGAPQEPGSPRTAVILTPSDLIAAAC